jgi:acyl-CoA synthetase (AMP-forming)/AMP-acid ligase II
VYLTQGLHRALHVHPERMATRFLGRTHTFREFGSRVAKLAGALRALGLGTGDRVSILALNSDRYLEYYLAVVWAGGVVNPINTRWTPAEAVYALNDCGATMLMVDEQFRVAADPIRKDTSALREVIYLGDGTDAPAGMRAYEAILAAAEPIPDAVRSGNDLAGVFYTGGTTGFPKGVMLSHANLLSSALSMLASGFGDFGPIALHVAPMFHLADVAVFVGQLLTGGSHVILPAFTPVGVLETIQKDRITGTLIVPTMIQMLVDHPDRGKYDLTSFKRLIYGASPIAEALLDRAMAALPGTEFVQAYGMTELSPITTLLAPFYHSPAGRPANKLRSVGRATCLTEVKICDPFGQEVPRGTVGEIVVRGPVVMQGYWGKPKETESALRGGWMHSGDGAYMDDEGFIFIVDRMKDMIVTGGENVYSVEVENAIAQHPSVATSAVIGIPSEKWGETVHAVVILKPSAKVTPEELQAHCRARIASYKCPTTFEFRDALPLSGAGKVLKTKLRDPFWQGKARAVN